MVDEALGMSLLEFRRLALIGVRRPSGAELQTRVRLDFVLHQAFVAFLA
jgi:hypothetical protein